MRNLKEMDALNAEIAIGNMPPSVLYRDPRWQRLVAPPNPYEAAYLAAGGSSLLAYEHRRRLVNKYSWAIPNDAALEAIAALGPIVEMGSGAGYWASLLRERGVDVVAYDAKPYRNLWIQGVDEVFSRFTSVRCGGPKKLRRHSDRTLFLCWPPYDDTMARDCLLNYSGNTVAYVGEGMGGCTGNDEFHHQLNTHWDLEREVQIPVWYGIHDSLFIYRRWK